MRSRNPNHEAVAEVARRRLELLSAELAGIRRDPVDPPVPSGPDGPGEPPDRPAPAPVPVPTQPPAPARPPGRRGRHARRPTPGVDVVAGWLEDRLPGTLQGRVQLGASHLTVVAVVVAAALAVACWWVLRAAGGGTSVPVAVEATPLGSPTALVTSVSAPVPVPDATGSPSGSGTIMVDVAGKVRRPGIATLPVGARVVDALAAAGGVRKGVPLTSLNLARVLTDGEQVVVGVPVPAGIVPSAAAGAAGTVPAMVNINTAGQTELETLPGVGPVTAQAILQWRSENGAFGAVDELLEVSGIGAATLAKIAPYVTL